MIADENYFKRMSLMCLAFSVLFLAFHLGYGEGRKTLKRAAKATIVNGVITECTLIGQEK